MATAPSQLGGPNGVPKFLHIKERTINPCPLHLTNCFAAHSLNNNNNNLYFIAPLSRQYSLTQLYISSSILHQSSQPAAGTMQLPPNEPREEEWPAISSSPSFTLSTPMTTPSSQGSYCSTQSYFPNTFVRQQSWAQVAGDTSATTNRSPTGTPANLKSRASPAQSPSKEAPGSTSTPAQSYATVARSSATGSGLAVSRHAEGATPPRRFEIPAQYSATPDRAPGGRRVLTVQHVEAAMRPQAQNPPPASAANRAGGSNNPKRPSVVPVIPATFKQAIRRGPGSFSMHTSAGSANRANRETIVNMEPLAQTLPHSSGPVPMQDSIQEIVDRVGEPNLDSNRVNELEWIQEVIATVRQQCGVLPSQETMQKIVRRVCGPATSSIGSPVGPVNSADGENSFNMERPVQGVTQATGCSEPGASSMRASAGRSDRPQAGQLLDGRGRPGISARQRRPTFLDRLKNRPWRSDQQTAIPRNRQPERSRPQNSQPELYLSQSPVVELEAWPVNAKGLALFAYAGWDQFQLFGDPIIVKVPVGVLGNKLSVELQRFVQSNGRFGHILNAGFIWSYADARHAVVRLGQDNWHRIMDNLRGEFYILFSDCWKMSFMKVPSEEQCVLEECGICKSEDPDYSPDEKPNPLKRRWIFNYVLRSHPSADGSGLEIRANHKVRGF